VARKHSSESPRPVYFTNNDGQKGVGIGCSEVLLAAKVDRGRWSFRLRSLHSDNEWLTGWINLKKLEDLRTSRQAKCIRDTLVHEFKNEAGSLLEKAIGLLQDRPEDFQIEALTEELPTEDGNPQVELHPAGGITSKLVYEPIGQSHYAFRSANGKRGIVAAREEREVEDNDRKARWYIVVDEERYYFRRKPENNWLFYTPKRNVLDSWVKGERKSLSTKDLWNKTGVYYRTFSDIPRPSEYSILALFCAQSWLTELLDNVFYVGINAEFGGGKTATGEVLVAPCRHGFQNTHAHYSESNTAIV
jgi:hypothetical protein